MAASAIPDRVPLGFVCGYPVGAGGELYGGEMFIKSAANDTLQGKAIRQVHDKWAHSDGKDGNTSHHKNGAHIGIPVCKKKYTPFHVVKDPTKTSKHRIERLFGCHCHHAIRKRIIEAHGERKGWEPFGQWSIDKARQQAIAAIKDGTVDISESSDSSNSKNSKKADNGKWMKALCNNGVCAWKKRGKLDDIANELAAQAQHQEQLAGS